MIEQSSGAIPVTPSLGEVEHKIQEQKNYPVGKRVFFLSIQAVINAIVIGLVAKALVALIAFITNLSFYGTFSFQNSSPAGNHLGGLVVVIPVIGAIIVGIMARYGSPAIRGHGIPEAMEQILVNESKIKPLIVFLKPVSAAISIGTGGPFGAEGPIISTGGAFGSLVGQLGRVTPNERKILLAAGACAGMAAIFGTPLAAVLLAIELLLFEFSPRSIIPVALSCFTGAAMHFILFGAEAVFAMPPIPASSSIALITYVALGAVIGIAAAIVSRSIYLIEDLFEKLPIHWMWWPAIGAVAVGIVGYISPLTLGVGYSNISHLLAGGLPLAMLFTLSVMKFLSWSISLGSGTSGGTLAPLLTIGGAFGSLLGVATIHLFPGSQVNVMTCALIGMAAMFAGASRALLTSIVFALEATMQPNGLLPLLGACTASYFVSFFMMRGSIMTEKMERRGVFAPTSYEPDVLQQLTVKEVYDQQPFLLPESLTIEHAITALKDKRYAVSEDAIIILTGRREMLAGVIPAHRIFDTHLSGKTLLSTLISGEAPYVYEGSRLALAVDLMVKYKVESLPVITHDEGRKVAGLITQSGILAAYSNSRRATESYQTAISLRRRSMRAMVRRKQARGNPL